VDYGKAVKISMEELARDPNVLFIGYNLTHGSRAYGSLKDIPQGKVIETPVAENLMAGLSLGLAIEGFKPILVFERHDFILNALDGLVNHLDKLNSLSHGQYFPSVIIRAILGSNHPIDPGAQHSQDFTEAFRKMFSLPIYDPQSSREVLEAYRMAKDSRDSSMIVERRDFYNRE
jgi:pyruvate dehydrogenase E1 component beta subunit